MKIKIVIAAALAADALALCFAASMDLRLCGMLLSLWLADLFWSLKINP